MWEQALVGTHRWDWVPHLIRDYTDPALSETIAVIGRLKCWPPNNSVRHPAQKYLYWRQTG